MAAPASLRYLPPATEERAMAAPVLTGIEAVDRELERLAAREPFASAEMAEAMAAKLVAAWRALQPWTDEPDADRKRQAHRR
jgi:hypothetical protein